MESAILTYSMCLAQTTFSPKVLPKLVGTKCLEIRIGSVRKMSWQLIGVMLALSLQKKKFHLIRMTHTANHFAHHAALHQKKRTFLNELFWLPVGVGVWSLVIKHKNEWTNDKMGSNGNIFMKIK